MNVEVNCRMCGGTGKYVLSGVYADTLLLLAKQKKPISGAALARIAKCKGEAMCNRLVALERHGFVSSVRYGRERLWKKL